MTAVQWWCTGVMLRINFHQPTRPGPFPPDHLTADCAAADFQAVDFAAADLQAVDYAAADFQAIDYGAQDLQTVDYAVQNAQATNDPQVGVTFDRVV